MADDIFNTFMGRGPKKIIHWEHWSCPDGETYLTGINAYDHPKLCRERLAELYPQLNLPVPETDDPLPKPEDQEEMGHALKFYDYLKEQRAKAEWDSIRQPPSDRQRSVTC